MKVESADTVAEFGKRLVERSESLPVATASGAIASAQAEKTFSEEAYYCLLGPDMVVENFVGPGAGQQGTAEAATFDWMWFDRMVLRMRSQQVTELAAAMVGFVAAAAWETIAPVQGVNHHWAHGDCQ